MFDFRRKMFLNNAEALYKLFTRNNNFNVLLNEKDRNEFNDIINGLPEERCSNSLQTFLALQVVCLFSNYRKIINVIISGGLFH